jgi:Protein of unknown function (DUF4238)
MENNAVDEKKCQHTVSRFYLRQFTPPTGQRVLWQYSKIDPANPVTKSPRAATTENYFYSVQRTDGTWGHTLEDYFGKVEDLAAPIVSRLIRGESLSLDDRFVLAFFMAVQIDRTTAVRQHADVQRQKIGTVEGTLRFIENNRDFLLSKLDGAEIERNIQEFKERDYGVPMAGAFYLPYLLQGAHRIAQLIASMAWSICRPKAPYFFVTSDNPVYTRSASWVDSPGIVGIKRRDLSVELGFPLSSDRYLLARWVGKQGATVRDTIAQGRVRELNRRTVICAHEYIFCREKSGDIHSLVHRYRGFRLVHPEMDI